jgi:hypothetical protein
MTKNNFLKQPRFWLEDNYEKLLKSMLTIALLTMVMALLSLVVIAQDHQSHHQKENIIIGKKGEIHFTQNIKAGTTVLKPGMYQVQHVMEGSDHVIVFKAMSMQAGYKHGNTPVGKEVVRIKCKVESLTKAGNKTKITLRTNSAGEKEIAEIEIAGEKFKHIL